MSALAFFWFIIAASEPAPEIEERDPRLRGSINIERSTTTATARGYYQSTDPNFSRITRKLLYRVLRINHFFFPCISLPPMQRYWERSLCFVLIYRGLSLPPSEEFSALIVNYVPLCKIKIVAATSFSKRQRFRKNLVVAPWSLQNFDAIPRVNYGYQSVPARTKFVISTFRFTSRWNARRWKRTRARGIADTGRSNARVAKNGDPRLKTEQRQGMQRIAAHLAGGSWLRVPGSMARTVDGLTTRSSRYAREIWQSRADNCRISRQFRRLPCRPL